MRESQYRWFVPWERRRIVRLLAAYAVGFDRHQIASLNAYRDRGSGGFEKKVPQLVSNRSASFASEPNIFIMRRGEAGAARLSKLNTA